MNPSRLFLLVGASAGMLSACAPARTTTTAPAPVPAPVPETPRPPAEAAAPQQPPPNWQLLDETTDRVLGIGAERALRELLAGKEPRRTVVVAVIDGGVDTAHADLRADLWRNPKELPGNRTDDDRNGYADDVYGWNFIGGRDGRSVQYDTYELTRLYQRCTPSRQGTGPAPTPAEPARCGAIEADFQKKRAEAEQTLSQVRAADEALSRATQILKAALGADSLTVARVTALRPTSADVQQARGIYLQLAAAGITSAVIAEAREEYETQLKYRLNPSFNPRPIVGDDTMSLAQRHYGNTDATGPDAEHGTHVAGIIGAVRGNNIGVDGVAPAVRIMSVRAVPDGDERDKDVANAIRYAVDNGAQIINMSFGKAYSPQKAVVDEAVKYADARGVLMIHAAGNEGENADTHPSFPTPEFEGGGRAQLWITVGATSWKRADSLVAPFSNYGRTRVDVFAPGVDILSTAPGGGYERQSGTSMAAPVVTGLAALIMAYYPELSAADVRRIILDSAARRPGQLVVRPGSTGERVPFESLSVTGGIVSAYGAVRLAQERAAGAR